MTLDCRIESEVWDGFVVLSATDISNEGLWVETPYALAEGEELVLSFEVPGAAGSGRVWAIAEVARVGMWRRRGDQRASGMGLVFTYCSEDDRGRLCAALLGRPPPLPSPSARVAEPSALPIGIDDRAWNIGTARRDLDAGEDQVLPAVLDPACEGMCASELWSLASE